MMARLVPPEDGARKSAGDGSPRRRFLVLDDDRAVAEMLRLGFERSGAEVVCATEAEEALAVLEYQRFDALIVDLNLGSPFRTEGLELVGEARYRARDVVIVVFTGSSDERLHEDCRGAGADDVVIKSSALRELHAAVERSLEKRRSNDVPA